MRQGGLVRRSPLEEEQAAARPEPSAYENLSRPRGLSPVLRDRMPDYLKRVVVITLVGRCCGYLDWEGVWRSDFSNEELDEVTGWQDL